jgi:hypothetical protein
VIEYNQCPVALKDEMKTSYVYMLSIIFAYVSKNRVTDQGGKLPWDVSSTPL